MSRNFDRARIAKAFELLRFHIEHAEKILQESCPIEVEYNGMFWSARNKRLWSVSKDKPLMELSVSERLASARLIPGFLEKAKADTEQFCRDVESVLEPKDVAAGERDGQIG